MDLGMRYTLGIDSEWWGDEVVVDTEPQVRQELLLIKSLRSGRAYN